LAILKFLFIGLILYGSLLVLVYFIQDSLLFFPDNKKFGNCLEMLKLGAKPIMLKSHGENLRLYSRGVAKARGFIVFFHGNAGSACHRYFYLEELKDTPLNFIFPEYPGYGLDRERASEPDFLKNAEALLKYIKKINTTDLPIILFGESLGTGIATYLASKYFIQGLILMNPYTSIGDIAAVHYPYLPTKLLIKNNFPAAKWATKVQCSVLILHGSQDSIIPINIAKKQANNFQTSVNFIEFPRAGHNDLMYVDPDKYWSSIREFILRGL